MGAGGNHVKILSYDIRHLCGKSIDRRVLDFKCKSVNFYIFFGNNIFCLQLFFSIESFSIHVSGINFGERIYGNINAVSIK